MSVAVVACFGASRELTDVAVCDYSVIVGSVEPPTYCIGYGTGSEIYEEFHTTEGNSWSSELGTVPSTELGAHCVGLYGVWTEDTAARIEDGPAMRNNCLYGPAAAERMNHRNRLMRLWIVSRF